MFKLSLHPDAVADLNALRASDLTAASVVVAVLEELEGDHDLLDRLTQHGYVDDLIDVSMWREQQFKYHRNLWRLRLIDLDQLNAAYRAVYAFSPTKRLYHVLAVVHRSFDYQKDHDITKRIVAVYDNLP